MREVREPEAADLLLVEDEEGDVLLIREAFKTCRARHNLSVVGDGEEALAFLRRQGRFAGAPRPSLILLDLNLPKLDGREVLQAVKSEGSLQRIPVIMLTTSDSERDIERAYELHVNAYLAKPQGLDALSLLARRIEDFWLDAAKLPRGA